ncbi:hypothetical protein DEI92_02995 [Curtobacterium sp. MCBD17_034]|uniref:hypothetical protein n=1 Tax=unclassified Curtobacterium TaxID=257496 RepID=UPI000DAA075F|nr:MULTISPECIES: hypothetical protein [unclassified Curtobacterium]PZF62464.1 hypothetical protein DEI92_02995 [Curtobacterium sp. MCBD17_034]PZM39829.1 hypothetical protein DEI90_03110 [Curtobacterium sp. MCBD17_031]WIE55138.1 hypothetical protein DEI88_002715 [Curtobacterium sp. MCBD17_003]
MTASNRTLGRVLLVLVGLVLLAGGLAVVALGTVPGAARTWHRIAPGALAGFGSGADRPASVTAWSIALGVALLVAVLALVVLATRGGGRVATVVEDEGTAAPVDGLVTIDSTAVQHALSSAIGALPEVHSLAVDVYRVRGARAVRIRVRPRQGSAPRDLTTRIEDVVGDLDAVLGMRLPVLLHIARGGAAGQPVRVH